jgi:hypothetical protein
VDPESADPRIANHGGARFATLLGMKLLGIALIVAGLLALAFGGISWTKREKVVDLGPIQAETRKTETLPLSPIFGVAAVVGGIAVLVVSSRK